MAKKKNNKSQRSDKQKAASLKNISNYNARVEEASQRQLNIQNEINAALDKRMLTGEKLTRSDKKHAKDLQLELDSRIKTANLLGRANVLNKKQLGLKNEELKVVEKLATGAGSTKDLYKDLHTFV